MASKVHNISGELTQELLSIGDNTKLSSISLCNTNALQCTVDVFIEKPTTAAGLGGTFYVLKNTLIPAGVSLAHSFTFDNSKFGLFIKLTKSASETPTVDVIIN